MSDSHHEVSTGSELPNRQDGGVHTHNGERSDVRLEARRRMAKAAGGDRDE